MNVTKRQIKTLLGATTDVELARFFDIGKAAVGHWPDDEPIPEGRYWQAMALRPDLFVEGEPVTDVPDKAA